MPLGIVAAVCFADAIFKKGQPLNEGLINNSICEQWQNDTLPVLPPRLILRLELTLPMHNQNKKIPVFSSVRNAVPALLPIPPATCAIVDCDNRSVVVPKHRCSAQ